MNLDPSMRFDALYSDGLSAAQHEVHVQCAAEGLLIESSDREVLTVWNWADVKLSEPPSTNRPIRLQNRATEGARLAIGDRSVLPLLERSATHLKNDPITKTGVRKFAIIASFFAAFVLFVVYGVPRLAGPLAESIPMDWEEDVGEGVVKTVMSIFGAKDKFCKNPKGVAALQHLTDRLAATVETPYRFKVKVAKSKVVNAFATPGGHVVILYGLIQKAGTPEEVAGVLAHEMGHVIKRHPTKALIHAYGWSMLITALTGVSGSNAEIASAFALHLVSASYSRGNEAEADDTAVEMLAQAKISNAGLVSFFEKLQTEAEEKGKDTSDESVLKYLASHPALHERIAAIKANPESPKGAAINADDWQAIKDICS